MECFLNTLIPTLVLLMGAFFSHSIVETLVWIITFSHLRKYTGGYHAPNQFACIFCSILLGLSNTFVIRYISIPTRYILLIYIAAFTINIVLCPIASVQKPLSHSRYICNKLFASVTIILYGILSLALPTGMGYSILYATVVTLFLAIVSFCLSSFF